MRQTVAKAAKSLSFALLATMAASVTMDSGAARAEEDSPPGWGMAIAARVIGEKCSGALKSAEIAELNTFISEQYAKSVATSGKGPAWWSDLRDKLEQSYVEKYSDAANCTEEAREQAEDLAEDVHDYADNKAGN